MQLAETEQLPDIHIHIEPSRGWISLKLRELWAYRELFYFLTWRDVKVRYKQTVLGAAWAIIHPVLRPPSPTGLQFSSTRPPSPVPRLSHVRHRHSCSQFS